MYGAALLVMLASGTLSGAMTGALVGALGRVSGLTSRLTPGHVAIVLVVLCALDLLYRTPVVSLRRWQVPVTWLGRGKLIDLVTWGATLGTGVLTRASSNVVLGLWVTILLTQESLAVAAALGASYGAARMLTVAGCSLAMVLRPVGEGVCPIPLSQSTTRRVRLASAGGLASLAVFLTFG